MFAKPEGRVHKILKYLKDHPRSTGGDIAKNALLVSPPQGNISGWLGPVAHSDLVNIDRVPSKMKHPTDIQRYRTFISINAKGEKVLDYLNRNLVVDPETLKLNTDKTKIERSKSEKEKIPNFSMAPRVVLAILAAKGSWLDEDAVRRESTLHKINAKNTFRRFESFGLIMQQDDYKKLKITPKGLEYVKNKIFNNVTLLKEVKYILHRYNKVIKGLASPVDDSDDFSDYAIDIEGYNLQQYMFRKYDILNIFITNVPEMMQYLEKARRPENKKMKPVAPVFRIDVGNGIR